MIEIIETQNKLEKILEITNKIESDYINSKDAMNKPLMVFGKYGADVVNNIKEKYKYWPVQYNPSPNETEINNSIYFKTYDYL